MQKYMDESLSPRERAEILLNLMTLPEKIAQMGCVYHADADMPDYRELIGDEGVGMLGGLGMARDEAGVAHRLETIQHYLVEETRLGIPALIHNEAVNGAIFSGAVQYPIALAQAATWDPELVEEMADCIRRQMLAVGYRHALSPVFDIGRDPRWGRLGETYGEDETLASAFAVAFVNGLQGSDPCEGVAATGKHFIGHGQTEGGDEPQYQHDNRA